jgi:hypothetical protein
MRLGNKRISSAPALAAEYKMTVNKDRLINSAN